MKEIVFLITVVVLAIAAGVLGAGIYNAKHKEIFLQMKQERDDALMLQAINEKIAEQYKLLCYTAE